MKLSGASQARVVCFCAWLGGASCGVGRWTQAPIGGRGVVVCWRSHCIASQLGRGRMFLTSWCKLRQALYGRSTTRLWRQCLLSSGSRRASRVRWQWLYPRVGRLFERSFAQADVFFLGSVGADVCLVHSPGSCCWVGIRLAAVALSFVNFRGRVQVVADQYTVVVTATW